MMDDNDRHRAGTLPDGPFADAIPMGDSAVEGDPESRAYRPFPVEVLPEPVCSFVAEAASAIGCDSAYVALAALAGLAASIGNTRRIQLKRSWFEPSVLWTATVGESGTLKSPALDVALAPLQRLQAKAIDQYRIEKKRYDDEMERCHQATRSKKPGPSGNELMRPDPPIAWRILCSDITVEALASRLQHAPRGLLLFRDELSGWISGFDQYKKTQGADAAHFLSMHRAGELLIDRKTNGEIIQIRQAAVSVTGGIQPKVLKRVLGHQYLDNGLAARLLLAKPPRLPRRWTEDEISVPVAAGFRDLYSGLLDLKFAVDADGERIPIDLPLTPSGRDAWVEFYNRHGLEQAQREGDIAAAFSKLEGYCARFALVIHLIRCQSGDPSLETKEAIDPSSIRAAVDLTTWFAYETERVYSALGITATTPSTGLMEIIRQHGGRISARALMRASRLYRGSSESAHAALQRLVDAGVGRWIRPSVGRGGCPGALFEIIRIGGDSGDGDKTLRSSGGHRSYEVEQHHVTPLVPGTGTTSVSVTKPQVL